MDDKDLLQQNEDQKDFSRAFNVAQQEDTEPDSTASIYLDFMSPLGSKLEGMWTEAQADRREQEQKWLKDLRQVKGEYDPEIKARLHPKRSKAFLSLTRTKTKTISSRMTDLLFPANGEKNWGIGPTPIPELNPAVIENLVQQYQAQTGEPISEEQIKLFINKEATNRCNAMEKEMADQLTELKYRATIREAIKSGNIYGTGILKGPLVKVQKSKRWLPGPDGEWVTVELEKFLPYCEFVPVWDIYPDMSARKPEDMRFIWQRYTMNRNQVYALSKRDDFKGDAIRAYIKAYRDGDAEYKNHENDLRGLNQEGTESSSLPRRGKYEVKEFWGYLDAEELADMGVEVDADKMGMEVAANVWMLGPVVIKAVISPIEGVTFPYHWYFYEKDDSSIWGEGIPSIMRDAQKLFNAAVRAMLDNAAISAGPIIEANVDLLKNGEDPRDLYPFRVFLREGTGSDASSPAIRVEQLNSHINEFMTMIQFFRDATDEITTIPRYMYGDTSGVGGAGQTASGLSMMMGAANVTLKDQIKNFDDGITVPFIRALYFWNMEFNEKEYVKGDYNVTAKGSTSLIAREVKSEALGQFMMATNNPVDLMYIKRDNTLREYVKVLDLDELDLIKDSNTVAIEGEQRAAAEQEEMNFQRQVALIKAGSGGHMPDAAKAAGVTPGLPQAEEVPVG